MIYTLTTTIGDWGKEGATCNKRVWGFYFTEEKARNAIVENIGNMQDCMYDYLVLERWPAEGVIAMADQEIWFCWNESSGGWQEIHDKPAFAKGVQCWAMG